MRFSRITLEFYPSDDSHRVTVLDKFYLSQMVCLPCEISGRPFCFCFYNHKLPRLGLRSAPSVLKVAQLLSPTMLISLHQQSINRLA